MLEVDSCPPTPHSNPRTNSAAFPRRSRLTSVPLMDIKCTEESKKEKLRTPLMASRRFTTGAVTTELPHSSFCAKGGICSMSDTMESLKGGPTAPVAPPNVRIKHITRTADGATLFPKLDECAHFHYENVELGPLKMTLSDDRPDPGKVAHSADKENEATQWGFHVQVNSNGRLWMVRRSYDNFRLLDRQLHRCVYDRKYSLLKELPPVDQLPHSAREEALRSMLTEYLDRFSQLVGSLINCGPVLNWLELDNRGNRLIVTDEAAINTPAIAAAYVIKRYTAQATDEISFEVGDMISVIDMPPPEESTWWRGKKGFEVGFFPSECVEVIGEKLPQTIKIPRTPTKPVLRKHGKLIAFFRSFLLSRPSRRKLKQSGILKERVFGCDLGEHLMNTGRDVPLVLNCCAEFIELHGIVDGIYRLSGVTSNIQKLRLTFDEDRMPDLGDEAILQDIHCVASLLKMYFRELPNPLLTYQLYDKFVIAVQADEDVRLLRLRDVVQQLPPPHYRTLEYLMRHLAKVAAHGGQTGMTPKNVAIVWAPNLLRSKDLEGGGVGALHVVGVQAVLTEYLIRYADIIFNDKMPMFHSPGPGEGTPKRTRPKSLAISTPTKLLSLEEARSRALSANLPTNQQKYIDVGGGPDNLPSKYHTVIDFPAGKQGSTKLKKSPSGWKSFFSRGWHSGSAREKDRRSSLGSSGAHSPRKMSTGSLQHSPLPMQDKAITEMDLSHTQPKKLRTVKSAESLISSTGGGTSCRNSGILDSFVPIDSSRTPSRQTSTEYPCSPYSAGQLSPSKSPSFHKHIRSVSHDSYFDHAMELPVEEEDEFGEDDDGGSSVSAFQFGDEVHEKLNDIWRTNAESQMSRSAVDFPFGEDAVFDADSLPWYILSSSKVTSADEVSQVPSEESPSGSQKLSRKQKLQSSESDVASPKVQKLSLKRFRQAFSSPSSGRKGDAVLSDTKGSDDASINRDRDSLRGSLRKTKEKIFQAFSPDMTVKKSFHSSTEEGGGNVPTSLPGELCGSLTESVQLSMGSLHPEIASNDQSDTSRNGSIERLTVDSSIPHSLPSTLETLAMTHCDKSMPESDISNTTLERCGNEETIIVEVHATQENYDDERGYQKKLNQNVDLPRNPSRREIAVQTEESDILASQELSDGFGKSEAQNEVDLTSDVAMEHDEPWQNSSVEATLSDTVSLSQLQSFEAGETGAPSESQLKDAVDTYESSAVSSSVTTPESPTLANVSDMPSNNLVSEGSADSLQEDEVVPEPETRVVETSLAQPSDVITPSDIVLIEVPDDSTRHPSLEPDNTASLDWDNLAHSIENQNNCDISNVAPLLQQVGIVGDSAMPINGRSQERPVTLQMHAPIATLAEPEITEHPDSPISPINSISLASVETDVARKENECLSPDPSTDSFLMIMDTDEMPDLNDGMSNTEGRPVEETRTVFISLESPSIPFMDENSSTPSDPATLDGVTSASTLPSSRHDSDMEEPSAEVLAIESDQVCVTISPTESATCHQTGSEMVCENKLLHSDLTSDFLSAVMQASELVSIIPDSSEPCCTVRARGTTDKPSPISPMEESRRKFESEIGRTIVRDRQMRLEMEQIQAEVQQKALQKKDRPLSAVSKDVENMSDVSFPTAADQTRDMLTEGVELRKPGPHHGEESESEWKRNSEPEGIPSRSGCDNFTSAEMKRLSEPVMVQGHQKSRHEKKASVKELMSKFEFHGQKDEDALCSVTMEDTVPKPKPTQPSLFTQLKVLKLQSLQPSSAQIATVEPRPDPWTDPILDREEDMLKDLVSPAQRETESEFLSRPPCRPHSLDIGKPPRHVSHKPSSESGRAIPVANPVYQKTPLSAEHSNGNTLHKLETVTNNSPREQPSTIAELEHNGDHVGSPKEECFPASPQRSTNSPLRSPAEDGGRNNRLSAASEDGDSTRRERINRYKEERRAQLREKLRSESFRVEAEEKERVQSQFRLKKAGSGGSKPTSPCDEGGDTAQKTKKGSSNQEIPNASQCPIATIQDHLLLDASIREDSLSVEKISGLRLEEGSTWVRDKVLRWQDGAESEAQGQLPLRIPQDSASVTTNSGRHRTNMPRLSSPEKRPPKSPTKGAKRPSSMGLPSKTLPSPEPEPSRVPVPSSVITNKGVPVADGSKSYERVPKSFLPQATATHVQRNTSQKKEKQQPREAAELSLQASSLPKCIRERAAMFERPKEPSDVRRQGQASVNFLRQNSSTPSYLR